MWRIFCENLGAVKVRDINIDLIGIIGIVGILLISLVGSYYPIYADK